MEINFFKYQGTGNDFIMIDDRTETVNFSVSEITKLCDRKFGIGADGIILLRNHPTCDFEMVYYNADGSQSFCGNGSRCAQAFAVRLGMIKDSSTFLAIDGIHEGRSKGDLYSTKMGEVSAIEKIDSDYFIHTGSPHYIKYMDDVSTINVYKIGREIRYSPPYETEGTNVNFVEVLGNSLKVRTYERGVENETLSCGTGVTAVAISYIEKTGMAKKQVEIETLGGRLTVKLNRDIEGHYNEIWLQGPALCVFEGSIKL